MQTDNRQLAAFVEETYLSTMIEPLSVNVAIGYLKRRGGA
jgi:hypothetical protein